MEAWKEVSDTWLNGGWSCNYSGTQYQTSLRQWTHSHSTTTVHTKDGKSSCQMMTIIPRDDGTRRVEHSP